MDSISDPFIGQIAFLGLPRTLIIIAVITYCHLVAGSVTKTTPNRSAEMNLNSTYFEATSTTSSTTSHQRLRTKDTASTVRTSLITNIGMEIISELVLQINGHIGFNPC